MPVHVGNVLSSDTFYNANPTFNEAWQRMGVLAVEMETAGLYATAAHAGVEALGIFTVSDSLVTGEATDAQARQTSFTTMMELAPAPGHPLTRTESRPMNKRDVAAMIDHTILKPEATKADVARIVEEGAAAGTFSVCRVPLDRCPWTCPRA